MAKKTTALPDTVTICCNYPRDVQYDVPDGSGKLKPLIISGNAAHLRGKSKGVLPIGAYGLTPNVPREAWEYIVKTRPDDPLIKSGCIFAADPAQAADEAAERKDIRHGFEPLDAAKGGVAEMKRDA